MNEKQLLYGVGKAISWLPEKQTKFVMEKIYDKYFLPKYHTKEEKQLAEKKRKSVEKWVKGGVYGVDAAIIVGGIVAGYRLLKNKEVQKTVIDQNPVKSMIKRERKIYHSIKLIERDDLPNFRGELIDPALPRIQKMSGREAANINDLQEFNGLLHTAFAPQRIPDFFLQNLGGRLFALPPGDDAQDLFAGNMIAEGGDIWYQFLHSEGIKKPAVIQNGVLRWPAWEKFVMKDKPQKDLGWFNNMILAEKFESVDALYDYFRDLFGYSFRGWMNVSGYLRPDTVDEAKKWMFELAKMGMPKLPDTYG